MISLNSALDAQVAHLVLALLLGRTSWRYSTHGYPIPILLTACLLRSPHKVVSYLLVLHTGYASSASFDSCASVVAMCLSPSKLDIVTKGFSYILFALWLTLHVISCRLNLQQGGFSCGIFRLVS